MAVTWSAVELGQQVLVPVLTSHIILSAHFYTDLQDNLLLIIESRRSNDHAKQLLLHKEILHKGKMATKENFDLIAGLQLEIDAGERLENDGGEALEKVRERSIHREIMQVNVFATFSTVK